MHITFLVHDIHFGGGGERVTANMANHYVEKGDQVAIVSIAAPNPQNVFTIDRRVSIQYLNINPNKGLNIIRKIKSVFAVRHHFRKTDNLTFLLGIGTYPMLLAALLPEKDPIIKIGCQHGSYASVKHIWFILRWILFRRLDAVVSLTNYDLPKLTKLNKNSFVIPNSIIFLSDQPALLQNKTILSIGRMDHAKGYDLLLEVFSHFCEANKEWKLRIIGDGPLRKSILDLITNKKLSGRVSIIPSSSEIEQEYLDASIYLMTSRTEGLPMVLLEAQACGLPVISFNCETGPSDIINDGIDGYLIDNFDIDKMTQKLSELCNDNDKRKVFGQNARINVKKFFPEPIYKKWNALFEQLTINY